MKRAFTIAALLLVVGCNGPSPAPAPAPSSSETKSGAPESVATISPAVPPADLTPEQARECQFVDCTAGTTVITAPAAEGSFFACQTEALSDYTNLVLGLVQMQKQLSGTSPNIDPATGEPVYEGETADTLATHRAKAGVKTFDEAVAHCQRGPHLRTVTVMNFVRGRASTWVSDERAHTTYWVPTNWLMHPKGQ